MRLGRVVFGLFFAMIAMFGLIGGTLMMEENTYADPETTTSSESSADDSSSLTGDGCQSSLGAIGWLVCPTTGAIAKGVDFLYGLIRDFLVIDPVAMEEGAPIYEIWKYFRGVTNIVFIIFLLVVIYSQITGLGISNYGIKKALPKLIVAAVLVNLSFLLCSLAVDVSNVVGSGLRGVFETIANSAVVGGDGTTAAEADLKNAEMFSAVAGGTALTIAGTAIAFETGAIWMLIPVLLGAIVAVVTGLITIALRQAVVALLIMISPLAVVAYMLPNTDSLFKRWKKLLTQMLVFYPMFSLLFGASNLAGFAIIMSAKDGFGVLLGIAVQIFPLFFSWKLMQMSGTFLGDINSKLRTVMSRPMAGARTWADSRRMSTKMKNLSSARPTTPSLRLMQFMSNRRIDRDTETAENAEMVRNRGLAYRASLNYDKNGVPTRRAMEEYENQARGLSYQKIIARDKNNMEKGLGQLAAVNPEGVAERAKLRAKKAELDELDAKMVKAADALKFEQARGEKIAYDNAKGFYKRTEAAMGAHTDAMYGYTTDTNGNRVVKPDYKFNVTPGSAEAASAAMRYSTMRETMEGNAGDVHFAAAGAAQSYDTQQKILATRMQKYVDMVPPTKNVERRLLELTQLPDAAEHIDEILPGLRVLNQRGDTDVVGEQINNILNSREGVELGTHASQALASFLMFEVKDKDPWLRRFGKYINLETARVYNKNERQVMKVTYDEYIKGYHEGEPDFDNPGQTKIMYAKKGMRELMEGTPLDGIERTALDNYNNSLIAAYMGEDGRLDVNGYLTKRDEIETAISPQFISANMKYLSGSEQIAAAAKSKTGFASKQKDDGTYEMVPIWDDDKFRNTFDGHVDEVKKWYQSKTLQYILDQTPSQVLGLRSDYKEPLMEHLANAYETNEMEGWSEEAKAERAEIMKEWAELQTQFGDLDTDEAKAEYEKKAGVLRRKMVGAQFRQLLDSKGKLNQIYRTRRSGAANNAKDWVREWLDLDDEIKITKKLEDDKRKMKKALEKEEGKRQGADVPSDDSGRIYSDIDMAAFVAHVDELWRNVQEEDDEVFYNESLEYVKNNLGVNSYIAAEYERFHKDDPYADSHMLKEYLSDLLNDPDNY